MLNLAATSSPETGCETPSENDADDPDGSSALANVIKQYSAESSQPEASLCSQDDVNHQKELTNSPEQSVIPEKRRKIENEANEESSYLRKYYFGKEKNLPKQLKDLFTPLKCNLCQCTMGSTITAKDHYEGKKHIASMKKWILEHPEYSEKYCLIETSQPKIINHERLYCRYCNIMTSSEQQAQSHYRGKKHQSVVNGQNMKNAFFSSMIGQWETWSTNNVEASLGIGIGALHRNGRVKETPSNQKFFCDICQVACPSQITFSDHTAGAKHKKRLAQLNDTKPSVATKDNILEDVIRNEKKATSPTDLSIYRTPSGKYYCFSCNVTVNSPIQFLQHSVSRKHKHKSSLPSGNKQRK